MNCACGSKAFFFEKITQDGIFNVYKCDTSETKKKGKCDFFYTEKIKDVFFIDPPPREEIYDKIEKIEKINPRELYIKKINLYIKLYKNVTHLPKEYSTNYIANINYILKRLYMPLFFEDKESIETLSKRIELNVCKKYIAPDNIFPIRLLEYTQELEIKKKVKSDNKRNFKSKRKVRTERKVNNKLNFNSFIEEEDKEEEDTENKSICSDSDSESNIDENDNTFDIDKYDSEPEDEVDDSGAFSD
tara:strand:- start:13180 stop:13917 length:738 start_codon:yes stop_codon:yes gene_type:complete